MKTTLMLLLIFTVFSSAVAETAEVTIGATLPLSGNIAYWGQDSLRGMNLAVDDVNARGGIHGRRLRVIPEDFGVMDMKRAAAAAEKLIAIDKVSALFTMWTEDTEVAAPIAERSHTLVISIAAGGMNVTNGRPLVFQMSPTDDGYVRALVDYAKAAGKKKLAIISAQIPYYVSLTDVARDLWNRDGEKLFVQEVQIEFLDFKPMLVKVKQGGYDALFMHVSEVQAGVMLKQIEELHLDILRARPQKSDVPEMMDVAKGAAEGFMFTQYEPAAREFETRFTAKYGSPPIICADRAYDAVTVFANAARENGITADAMAAGLFKVRNFPGASGLITITGDRRRLGTKVQLKAIRGGKAEVIRETE